MPDCYRSLYENLPREIFRPGEALQKHTTFSIGGPADLFAMPQTTPQLQDILQWAQREKVPYFVLGNGSNVLFADAGFRGVVISTAALRHIDVQDDRVIAQAGARLGTVALAALQHGLQGLEFAAGIPASLGGAVVMNAGAYDGEMAQVLLWADVLRGGAVVRMPVQELELSYRHSALQGSGDVVLGAALQLHKGDPAAIRARMDDLAARRSEKQPLQYPSAGSFFKRPAGYFAAALIDQAGLKGCTVGGAQISEKHAGFMINRGGATAHDVLALKRLVQQRVYECFGVRLEAEVCLVDEWGERVTCDC